MPRRIRGILGTRPPMTSSEWYIPPGVNANTLRAVYIPYGAASAADALLNQYYPDVDHLISVGSDPSWSASAGFTFNGSGQYLNTSIDVSNGYTNIVMKVANISQVDGCLLGINSLQGEYSIQRVDAFMNITNGTTITFDADGTTGIAITDRAYRNGVLVDGSFTPLGSMQDSPYIGSIRSGDGSPDLFYGFDLLWMVYYRSIVLTEQQIAYIYANAPI